VDQLPLPRTNLGRIVYTTLTTFGVLGVIAGILIQAIVNPPIHDLLGILGGIALGSIIVGGLTWIWDMAPTIWRRVSAYPHAAGRVTSLEAQIEEAAGYIDAMNSNLAIQSIDERDGTVHLVFPYGKNTGLTEGAVLEVVRESSAEILGVVEVVEAHDRICWARPVDRRAAEFWEHLEDRMKKDFSPPADTVGRTYQITALAMSDLLTMLRRN